MPQDTTVIAAKHKKLTHLHSERLVPLLDQLVCPDIFPRDEVVELFSTRPVPGGESGSLGADAQAAQVGGFQFGSYNWKCEYTVAKYVVKEVYLSDFRVKSKRTETIIEGLSPENSKSRRI